MTDLGLPLLAALFILGSVAVAVGGLMLWRRMVKGQSPRNNEFIGLIFATVALLYSVLMAFVVFSVWQRFTDSARSVTDEASAAVVAYRDTQTFPEPLRSEAQAAFRAYLTEVMDNEWASHGSVRPHRSRDALNPVWNVYLQYQPTEPIALDQFSGAQTRLHDLELQRHERHLAGEASLPNVFWWLIIGGAVVTIAMSYFFVVERRGVHALQVGLLTGVIAGVLALVFALNFPFTGSVHVSRGPFKHALLEFSALDLQPGSPSSTSPPAKTQAVTVDARRAWTDTGVDLVSGDRVSVSATGTIFHDPSSTTGPNGVAERLDLQQFNVLKGENHAGLIGRVGDNGAPFAVGSDFASTNLAPGRLFLGINDVGVDNNSGSFSAIVTIRRP
ncbi:MAG TPA: hypothetical protein VHT97_11995 [Acidimicrobiales bacterium]|nr:hypothetical protein [Acidimicrobiales bacterium]